MPKRDIYMPSLTFLELEFINMVSTNAFREDTTPNLLYLYLSGNPLEKFPEKTLKAKLIGLGFRECDLKLLPSYLSEFKELRYLDARDNNISIVDNDIKHLIKRNHVESYFSGNPVCNVDDSLDCKPLCSKSCWSREVSNDG